jgi:hypothetical protein
MHTVQIEGSRFSMDASEKTEPLAAWREAKLYWPRAVVLSFIGV